MIDYWMLISVGIGVAVLLLLILVVRLQAFLSMLIASILVGLLSGMSPKVVLETVQKGMGGTLGYVAIVVGLGAIFGAILEQSGGAQAVAQSMLRKFGEKRASWAMVLTGFFVAIPVFFDVAFIILIPLVYSLQRKTGKSILLYAIPLLAGLAITHAFIPPTPGPIAIAEILQVDLGAVILFGFIVGLPTAIVSGPVFGKFIASKLFIEAPEQIEAIPKSTDPKLLSSTVSIVGLPILLIVANTVINSSLFPENMVPGTLRSIVQLAGHPFVALIIANLFALYFLGIKRGVSGAKLQEMSTRSLAPAGTIILLTGAGGVFKQMLIDTGTGEMLASYFADKGLSIFLFAFLVAAIVRILQGSSTVAMITAAGLVSPLIDPESTMTMKALTAITIASGSSIMSHVNDSGFWLVKQYLGMSEKESFKSWTVMTTILALTSFVCVLVLAAILPI
ncbi:MAG: gluconate:H+ symporter [Bacteroidota bacterium]